MTERYLRTDFLRALAHALRSPLGVSRGAIEELATAAPADVELLADMAHRNLQRILDLAQQLEWVAEVESGTLAPRLEACDLVSVVGEVARGADESGLRVERDLPESPCRLLADVPLLSRAIRIALDNAKRFARNRVHLAVQVGEGSCVVVIDDDGPGIDPARLDLLFDRYVSARERGADSDLALGLSLARDYIHMHEGSITLERAPAGGTRCRIELPRTHGPEDHD